MLPTFRNSKGDKQNVQHSYIGEWVLSLKTKNNPKSSPVKKHTYHIRPQIFFFPDSDIWVSTVSI